jgi:hypothetical protein
MTNECIVSCSENDAMYTPLCVCMYEYKYACVRVCDLERPQSSLHPQRSSEEVSEKFWKVCSLHRPLSSAQKIHHTGASSLYIRAVSAETRTNSQAKKIQTKATGIHKRIHGPPRGTSQKHDMCVGSSPAQPMQRRHRRHPASASSPSTQ